MDIETIRAYCLQKPLATEDSAFGPEGILFRVTTKYLPTSIWNVQIW